MHPSGSGARMVMRTRREPSPFPLFDFLFSLYPFFFSPLQISNKVWANLLFEPQIFPALMGFSLPLLMIDDGDPARPKRLCVAGFHRYDRDTPSFLHPSPRSSPAPPSYPVCPRTNPTENFTECVLLPSFLASSFSCIPRFSYLLRNGL